MDCKIIYKLLLLVVFFTSTQTHAIEFKGKFIQGHFIIGKTDPETKILIDKKKVKVSKNGYFAFGIEKERKLDITITVGNKNIRRWVCFSNNVMSLNKFSFKFYCKRLS